MKSLLAAVLAAVLVLAAALAVAQAPVPALKARVTDLTATLTPPQVQALESSLREFEQRKGSQIAVLIIPTTQPEAIEQYSIRVAEAWKIGRGRIDDGLIVVVAKNDRKVRIEVGRGLEGVVPDLIASRVIREIITPHFKAGDFYGGLTEATRALMKRIEGEPLPAPASRGESGTSPFGQDGYLPFFLVLLFLVFVVGGVLARTLGRVPGAVANGGIVGGLAWIVMGGLAGAIVMGFFAFVMTLVIGSNVFSVGRGGRGTWVSDGLSGRGWSSGGWSGGGGGGGFSGGGGSFGGGGSSGSW